MKSLGFRLLFTHFFCTIKMSLHPYIMTNNARLCFMPIHLFPSLYYQLKLHIESQIRSGAWQPGDQVSSESTLGEKFQVSRTTVRQALGELVNQGLLTRTQGKGTFIAQVGWLISYQFFLSISRSTLYPRWAHVSSARRV